jgi:hypothetical protein
VVVYIRSLEPVHNVFPTPQIPFPVSRLIQSAPQPVLPEVAGNEADRISRGRYLSRIGGCIDCHTPEDQMHRPIKDMEFAGGKQIEGLPARSVNLTPDPTGISYYDEALFVRVLRTGHVGARPQSSHALVRLPQHERRRFEIALRLSAHGEADSQPRG